MTARESPYPTRVLVSSESSHTQINMFRFYVISNASQDYKDPSAIDKADQPIELRGPLGQSWKKASLDIYELLAILSF
jgi:hypothetical protein